LGKKQVGMLHGGHARIVAPVAVHGSKPEELVAADVPAQANAPGGFAV
jgi:hypothetical protein